MNKFNPNFDEKLTALLIYTIFKKPEGLDAFYIADSLGMNFKDDVSLHDEIADIDEPLKSWIRLGGKVNFAWFENHGQLEWLTMGQYQFEGLRYQDQILYAKIKEVRGKTNKRWSSDRKQIQPKILAAKSLLSMKPSQESLELTWQSMKSYCARKLQQCNMQAEAKKIQELSLKRSFDLKN